MHFFYTFCLLDVILLYPLEFKFLVFEPTTLRCTVNHFIHSNAFSLCTVYTMLSGDREGEDTDHYSNATGLTGSGGGGTAGGIGTGTLTGAGGAARRVAPSVLGASRRSSLSAPLRVLPRPPKDEEGYEEGSAVKRR
jgi:hypothetical protein